MIPFFISSEMEAAQRKMKAALAAPGEKCLRVAIFGTSHVRRVFDDCAGRLMKSEPQSGAVVQNMFLLPASFSDQVDITMFGVGGLTMLQFWDNYYMPSSSVSRKLFNISDFFREVRERGTECIILQIGDNDVDDFVDFQIANSQSLDAKTTADDIIQEILRVARHLQHECRASIKCIFLLPLMPRYIQGKLDKKVKVDNYNAVAEQVNSGLRNLLENDDVIKFFHAGKKFNFSGESYIHRAEQFQDDGVHLKMGQSPSHYGWILDNMKRCIVSYHNSKKKEEET